MNKNIIAGACQMNPLNQDNFCLGMLSGADCSIHFCNLTHLPVLVLGFVDLHTTDVLFGLKRNNYTLLVKHLEYLFIYLFI